MTWRPFATKPKRADTPEAAGLNEGAPRSYSTFGYRSITTLMITHAFEIGFDAAGHVIDHSEVWFDDIPGTSGFEGLLPKIRSRLGPVELALIPDREAWLRHTVAGWVELKSKTVSFTCDRSEFRLDWKREFETAAHFSLREGEKLAASSLLISGREPVDESSPMTPDARAALHFLLDGMQDVREVQEVFGFEQAKRLISMTRRPLMASVFWGSPPEPLSDLRTAQRTIAYAFFKAEGVIA